MPDARVSNTGPPVEMGPAGFWLDAQGNVAATDPSGVPQVTPGMRDNPQATIYYDSAKDLDYNLVNGHRVYHSPVSYENGKTIYKKSKSGPAISDTGGGLVHGGPQWNPQEGKWDVNLDWGKVLSWAAAAGISAGAIAAASGPAAATSGAAATTPAAAGAPATAAIATPSAAAAAPAAATASAIPPAAAAAPTAAAVTSNLTGDLLRYGVPVAGNVIGGLIQAHAQGKATDAQQKYLEEALAYEKQRDAAAIALEGNRYSDYSGRIAPYLATGASANTRMAGLLGLPSSQSAPAAPRSAPLSTVGSPTTPRPLVPDQTAMVTMRAPDGSTKAVPASELQHWLSVGATQVGASA